MVVVRGVVQNIEPEKSKKSFLELDHLSLPLLVTSQLEVLGPLDGALETVLAGVAFQTENQLLGGLGLENKNKRDKPKCICIQLIQDQKYY